MEPISLSQPVLDGIELEPVTMVTTYDGEVIPESESVQIEAGHCAGCYAHRDQTATTGNNEAILRSHSFECEWCGNLHPTYERYCAVGCYICYDCYVNDTFECDSCGRRLHDDRYGSNGCCDDCYGDDRGVLNNYSFNDYSNWDREDSSGTQFGIELECEAKNRDRDGTAKYVVNMFPSMYICAKEDGSLDCEAGLELVTRPDALHVHKRIWKEHLPALRDHIKAWRGYCCGMHVHVGRKTLTKLQIAKMSMFMHSPDTGSLITHCAGREPGHYNYRPAKSWGNHDKSRTRYESLNLTNRNTVEFRIFRANAGDSGFMRNLEFCDAVVEFCRPCLHSCQDIMQAERFIRFCLTRENTERWPNLAKHLMRFN